MSKNSNKNAGNNWDSKLRSHAKTHWLSAQSNSSSSSNSKKTKPSKPKSADSASLAISEIFLELVNSNSDLFSSTSLSSSVLKNGVVAASSSLFQRANVLDSLQYLEKFLWPNFSENSKDDHVVSIAVLVIVKNQNDNRPWEFIKHENEKFSTFFHRLLSLISAPSTDLWIKSQLVHFLNIAVSNLDIDALRNETAPLVSILIWSNLSSDSLRNSLLSTAPALKKLWKHYQKKLTNAEKKQKQDNESQEYTKLVFTSEWLYSLTISVLNLVYNTTNNGESNSNTLVDLAALSDSVQLQFVARFLEFAITLVSQLPTKRFTNNLFLDTHLVPALKQSSFYKAFPNNDHILPQQVELLDYYLHFPINVFTGAELSQSQVQELHTQSLKKLRQTVYEKFSQQQEQGEEEKKKNENIQFLSYSTLGALGNQAVLLEHLSEVDFEQLKQLCELLNIRTSYDQVAGGNDTDAENAEADASIPINSREFLVNCILYKYKARPAIQEIGQSLASMPTEKALFSNILKLTDSFNNNNNSNIKNNEAGLNNGTFPLPLPKMSLQYLNMLDFFMRAFQLERYASFSDIKSDVETVVSRLKPQIVAGKAGPDGEYNLKERQLKLGGYSKMGAKIVHPVSILEVAPPKVGTYISAIASDSDSIGASGSNIFGSQGEKGKNDFRGISQINSDANMIVPPGSVKAEVAIEIETPNNNNDNSNRNSSFFKSLVHDWDSLMPGDVVFLAELTTPSSSSSATAWEKAGIKRIRSGQVINVLDEKNRIINAKRNAEEYNEFDEFSDDGEDEERDNVGANKKHRHRHNQRRRVRKLHLYMDALQYAHDIDRESKDNSQVYQKLNVVIRRRPHENNFFPILENIKNIMIRGDTNTRGSSNNGAIPEWLTDVFLGFGDAGAASYDELHRMLAETQEKRSDENELGAFPKFVNYRDTFLDNDHLHSSFPDYNVDVVSEECINDEGQLQDGQQGESKGNKKRKAQVIEGPSPPYILPGYIENGGQVESNDDNADGKPKRLNVVAYKDLDMNSSISSSKSAVASNSATKTKANHIRFTPRQVQALVKATGPGLNLVVGPPGTGKTDVAVQMISNLVHNFPQEKTLVVAHSNQALNHIFEKIVGLDVDDRYLLRLGGGGEDQLFEERVQSNGNFENSGSGVFSQHGRVNQLLLQRGPLLEKVDTLAQAIGVFGAYGDSCETGILFYEMYIQPRWEQWNKLVNQNSDTTTSNNKKNKKDTEETVESLIKSFPFATYFSNSGLDVEQGQANILNQLKAKYEKVSKATTIQFLTHIYKRHLEQDLFLGLKEIRPFELVRSNREKARLMLVRQAKVVAMTATYAAIHRQELIDNGFGYDNLVVEEAAQLTELETVVLLTLKRRCGSGGTLGTMGTMDMTGGQNDIFQQKELDKIQRYLSTAGAHDNNDENQPGDKTGNQAGVQGGSARQRVILIGDDRQNAPIVKNVALRAYSRLDQSLFGRLVRLGVPITMLDMQGRARPELVELYGWQYRVNEKPLRINEDGRDGGHTGLSQVDENKQTYHSLGHLPRILNDPMFSPSTPNAGFSRVCQLIDVGLYKNVGETEPSKHMIQNVGEAEYAVALYQYMRLLGYPRESITILCAYYGQKKLIEEIATRRCGRRNQLKDNDELSVVSMFGYPGGGVKTIDEYQGEQNDFIILSTVRTKSVGFLRDRRRLTVAMSRARRGLYVLGNQELMNSLAETEPIISRLLAKSPKSSQSRLEIVTGEMYGSDPTETRPEPFVIESVEHLGQYVFEMAKRYREYRSQQKKV